MKDRRKSFSMDDRMFKFVLAVLVIMTTASSTAVPAAASDVFRGDGATLRLVAEKPRGDGRFRAALLVDLEPGWKTYWLDPGEAGIPPKLDTSGSVGIDDVAAHFPAPHRFNDGFSTSTIYSEPLAVALDGRATMPDKAAELAILVTLGVCRDVCLPLTAKLATPLDDAGDDGLIDAAFAALPMASTVSQGVTGARLAPDGRSLVVSVAPGTIADDAELFVAGTGGWFFGEPSAVARTLEAASFTLPVTGRPRKSAAGPFTIDAILVDRRRSWRVEALPVGSSG